MLICRTNSAGFVFSTNTAAPCSSQRPAARPTRTYFDSSHRAAGLTPRGRVYVFNECSPSPIATPARVDVRGMNPPARGLVDCRAAGLTPADVRLRPSMNARARRRPAGLTRRLGILPSRGMNAPALVVHDFGKNSFLVGDVLDSGRNGPRARRPRSLPPRVHQRRLAPWRSLNPAWLTPSMPG